jgi:hypothetical protein
MSFAGMKKSIDPILKGKAGSGIRVSSRRTFGVDESPIGYSVAGCCRSNPRAGTTSLDRISRAIGPPFCLECQGWSKRELNCDLESTEFSLIVLPPNLQSAWSAVSTPYSECPTSIAEGGDLVLLFMDEMAVAHSWQSLLGVKLPGCYPIPSTFRPDCPLYFVVESADF